MEIATCSPLLPISQEKTPTALLWNSTLTKFQKDPLWTATQHKEITSFSSLGIYKFRNQEKKLCILSFELGDATEQFHWNIAEPQF